MPMVREDGADDTLGILSGLTLGHRTNGHFDFPATGADVGSGIGGSKIPFVTIMRLTGAGGRPM